MPKYVVRIFSSFCSSAQCKTKFETIGEAFLLENYGNTKDIYITDGDDYTHVIILNIARPQLHNIPKENVIGLACEPPHFLGLTPPFVEYAQQYIGKYFIGQCFGLPAPFIEHHGFMWHTTPLKSIPASKPHKMSIMFSQKNRAPGHKYRHELVSRILASDLPIDIMGRGCKYSSGKTPPSFLRRNFKFLSSFLAPELPHFPPDSRLKGEFHELEPYLSYQFHIAIENFQLNHYFSEKILDPLFCGTTPVYLGCTNIDTYFPGMVIRLSGGVDKDMELLRAILNNPEQYRRQIRIEDVKNTTSLVKNIPAIFG
jgi:hypothetical protein